MLPDQPMSFRGRGALRAASGAPPGRRLPHSDARVPRERRGQTLRKIVAFFRPYRLQVGVVLVAILSSSFLGLINPFLLKLLIDDAIGHLDFGKLNLYVGLMIAFPIIAGLIGVGQSYLNNVIGQNVMQDLRAAL